MKENQVYDQRRSLRSPKKKPGSPKKKTVTTNMFIYKIK